MGLDGEVNWKVKSLAVGKKTLIEITEEQES